ncbi:MAG TPA: LD-carboxypeptidase [Streptosporangiaceae bacterium]
MAIVATSSPVRHAERDRLRRYFADRGYDVWLAPSTTVTPPGYLAGPRAQRAADLMAAFTDPTVTLIVPATGGKGAAHLLDLLDYDAIRANPKVFTGMSDPSILGNAIFHRAGLPTLHGPSGYDFFQPTVNTDTESAFWQIVATSIAGQEIPGADWHVVRGGGLITGRLLGGHLGTTRTLVGTHWMPDVTGAVLALEEVFVPWAAVDVALTHLRLAGVFDRIAALVVGVPVDCPRDDAPDRDWDEMILRCVGGDFPVVTNVEFGHTAHKIPLVIGGEVTLNLETSTPALRYVDALVHP